MNSLDKQPASDPELRRRAEARASETPEPSPEELGALSPESTRRLIHDLHVHQIELEMQNEELRRAQLALGASTAKYIDLYDSAPAGYCTLSEDGSIEQANLTSAALLGVDRGLLIGQAITCFILAVDQDVYYLHHRKLLASGEGQSCELRMLRPDGRQLWVHLTLAAARDAGGKPVQRIVLSDITGRKQRDAQLRLQALVLDQIQDHVTITDLDGVVTYVNQAETRRFGRPAERMLGRHVSAYGDSPEADATQREIAEATLTTGAWHGKVINFLADGSRLLLDLRTTLIKDEEGKPVAMVGVGTDITARGQAAEALRLREQYQRALLDNFPFLVWLKDEQSRYLAVNRALADYHGWPSPQSLIGKNDLDISPPDLAQKYMADDQAVLASGASRQFEELIEAKGKRRCFETYKSPLAVDGTIIGTVGFARDITERKRRDAALVAAVAEARKANHAKSRFLAAASHDLRQPLAALSLYVGVLKIRISPELADLVDNIRKCVDSLSELLTDLLDVSKLDAGVVIPRIQDFPIDPLLTSLVSVHSAEARLKGVRLRWRKSSAVARTDQMLLNRILGNLVANAIRYTDAGGVLVACRRHQGKLWVEVWDTGIGIAEDKTELIFEEFRQLGDDARNRGSGLGLAIVAKSARLLGLQMRVRSRPGRGSLFAVELPQGRALARPNALQHIVVPRPLRIGLVEDNAEVLRALVMVLEDDGHQVLAAASGRELLDRLGKVAPDLIISDYRLSAGETGFNVIETARATFNAELPAVLITGDTDPGLIRSMSDRGIAVHYKPRQIDALRAFIGEIAERRASDRSLDP